MKSKVAFWSSALSDHATTIRFVMLAVGAAAMASISVQLSACTATDPSASTDSVTRFASGISSPEVDERT